MALTSLTPRSPSERRAYPRIAAPVLVRYGTTSATNAGYAFDISEGGLGFTGEELEPIGCEVRIRFKWDAPLGEWFDVRAVVRHVQGKKMGVQFLDLRESVKIKLVEMIYQEMTGRRRN
jgi:c-di-GMP-binding flagellar brake protein YcgR